MTTKLTLRPDELRDLCKLAGLDESDDDITIGWLDEHEDGPGWYAWLAEYPEEGSVAVHDAPAAKTDDHAV